MHIGVAMTPTSLRNFAAQAIRTIHLAVCLGWNVVALACASLPAATMAEAAAAYAPPEAAALESDETVEPGLPAPECGCQGGHRTPDEALSGDVLPLLQAAQTLDEEAFIQLLTSTPDVARLKVGDRTLLAALVSPASANDGASGSSARLAYWEMDAAKQAALREAHRATLPVRMRMLAAALKQGLNPGDTSNTEQLPPLHLALLFGSPAMVDLLLASGADPNQAAGTTRKRAPIEFMFDSEYTFRLSGLPDLVSRSERSAMLLSLIKAGAKRPFAAADGVLSKPLDQRTLAENTSGPVRTGRAADYLLWPPLVEMTEGSAVLTAFLGLGTHPQAVQGEENLFARAAFAGNQDAVAWLQQQLARHVKSKNDDPDVPERQRDVWAEAALASMDGPFIASRLAILKLLVDGDTDWGESTHTRFDKHYLIGLKALEREAFAGHSLMSRLVATGDMALVDWMISTGAIAKTSREGAALQQTLRGELAVEEKKMTPHPSAEALTTALMNRRVDMVQRLLAAGVSPLSAAPREPAPLSMVLDCSVLTGGPMRLRDGVADQRFCDLAVPMLLSGLKPEEVRISNTAVDTPLAAAVSSKSSRWRDWVDRLLAAGFTLDKLPVEALASTLQKRDEPFALAMLDAGVGKPRNLRADSREFDADDEAYATALRWAAVSKNPALLDRLSSMRKPGAVLTRWQRGAMVELAAHDLSQALETLKTHGWVFDKEAAQEALDRMNPAAIGNVLKHAAVGFGSLCLAPVQRGYMPLLAAVHGLSDESWHSLLALGVARLPSCITAVDADLLLAAGNAGVRTGENEPVVLPMTALATALLQNPFAVAGGRKERVSKRISELRRGGMHKADFSNADLKQAVAAVAHLPVLQSSLHALGREQVKVGTAVKPSSPSVQTPARLLGSYQLEAREAAARIVLRPNGRFEWTMIYGATDEFAKGKWRVEHDQVIFESDAKPAFNWFKLTGYTQYDDGPPVGQPVTIWVDIHGSRLMDGVRVQVHGVAHEMKMFVAEDARQGTSVTLASKPQTLALWFRESNAALASEVSLPDVDRLKSLKVALQLPDQAPARAFNQSMKIENDGLRSGYSFFKKANERKTPPRKLERHRCRSGDRLRISLVDLLVDGVPQRAHQHAQALVHAFHPQHRRDALAAVLDRPADRHDVHAQLGEVFGQTGLGQREQVFDALAARQRHRADVQAHRDERKPRLLFAAEVVVGDDGSALLLALTPAELGEHRQAGDLRNLLARQLRRVDDAAVQRVAAGQLEGQGGIGRVRVGQHDAGAADQPGRFLGGTHQAMHRAGVVLVGLALAFAHRLEAELTGVHVVAYEEDVVDALWLQRGGDREITLVPVAEVGSF